MNDAGKRATRRGCISYPITCRVVHRYRVTLNNYPTRQENLLDRIKFSFHGFFSLPQCQGQKTGQCSVKRLQLNCIICSSHRLLKNPGIICMYPSLIRAHFLPVIVGQSRIFLSVSFHLNASAIPPNPIRPGEICTQNQPPVNRSNLP